MTLQRIPDDVKSCSRCGEVKPISEFYVRSRPRRAFLAHCKACHKLWATPHRELSPYTKSWVNFARAARLRGIPFSLRQLRDGMGEPGDCHLCGDPVGTDASIDHVIPVSRGGGNGLENLRWSHGRCNRVKTDLTVEELCSLAAKILAFQGAR